DLLGKVIRFGGTLVLARLISPSDLGLYGLAIIIQAFFLLFKDLGVGPALVQRPLTGPGLDRAMGTAFTLQLVACTALAGLILGLRHVFAAAFHQPGLATLLLVTSLSLATLPFGMRANVLLERGLRFGVRGMIDLASTVSFYAIALWLAYKGFGSLGLAWGLLASNLLTVVASNMAAPGIPLPRFDRAVAKDLLEFGTPFTLSGVVGFAWESADRLLIGAFAGTGQLGYYTIAYNLVMNATVFSGKVSRVSFPIIAKLSASPVALQAYLREAYGWVALLSVPLAIVPAVLAGPLVAALYGDTWLPAAPMMALLGLSALVSFVWGGFHWVVVSGLNRPQLSLRINLLEAALLWIAGFFLVDRWGGVGMAIALLASSLLSAALWWPTIAAVTGLRFEPFLAKATGVIMIIGGAGWAAAATLPPGLPWVAVACIVLAGSTALALTWALRIDVRGLIRLVVGRRGPGPA
ncbi:MAG: teichuronic acid exporter, partial [Thermoplasmata archaeon]|nr:teichuronic acid exporter [Thermoplasmata archaeon]